ncbi:hypothetical protein ACEN2J_20540 [Pseudorhodobacter sp. W20_MBD10_FR17]|uniref:hypothetical protein n=1 Tax=Pseudorhodobacter sp. W20_MBD10_FR17 TaxID=3240266 RepID=UPI003F966A48
MRIEDTFDALFRASGPLLAAVFGGWIIKELLGDIPNAGGSWPVIADTASWLIR